MAVTFDPLSPATAGGSGSQALVHKNKDTSTFKTLTRERQFRHPPTSASDVPALDELVKPHLESFNALIEDTGANAGGKGLLQLGVEDIGEKAVFDGKGDEERPWGNKITCGWIFVFEEPDTSLRCSLLAGLFAGRAGAALTYRPDRQGHALQTPRFGPGQARDGTTNLPLRGAHHAV
jgi:hypothetical protein